MPEYLSGKRCLANFVLNINWTSINKISIFTFQEIPSDLSFNDNEFPVVIRA